MKKKNIFKKITLFLVIINFCNAELREVIVPVTDLKIKPFKSKEKFEYPLFSEKVPHQDSQLLLGEYIYSTGNENVVDSEKWIVVETLEQTKCDELKLEFKTGWVKETDTKKIDYIQNKKIVVINNWAQVYSLKNKPWFNVSIGTKFYCLKLGFEKCMIELPGKKKGYINSKDVAYFSHFDLRENNLRKSILKKYENFLEIPYSWGARSSFDPEYPKQTGFDCSSFVNLLYRTMGLEIPRDAKDQYNYCNKIKWGSELETGDLIFLADKKTPEKINHVLLYLDGENIQESIGSAEPFKNRITTFKEKIGKMKNKITSGNQYGKKIVYLGSLLNNPTKREEMRRFFFNYDLMD
ncbi:hypothetical protein GF385_01970 [Candidatus Dependentiae bacterium]|nr:hypothetical protein [Candidatus Dependentiae bacterium]